jgi:hypothetical protein
MLQHFMLKSSNAVIVWKFVVRSGKFEVENIWKKYAQKLSPNSIIINLSCLSCALKYWRRDKCIPKLLI